MPSFQVDFLVRIWYNRNMDFSDVDVRSTERRINLRKNVLNNGYVELVESMGGDYSVIRNARRCYKSESKGEESDRKLISHLLTNKHMTPFESMVFTFDIKCPLFIARQWMRHRHGSFNEESLRYCVAERDFYIPDYFEENSPLYNKWVSDNQRQFDSYELFVRECGMTKEQARSLLPLGIYTSFYWTVNGSSLLNFLRLRTDKHAQKEMQDYAWAIVNLVKDKAPVTFGIFGKELILNS